MPSVLRRLQAYAEQRGIVVRSVWSEVDNRKARMRRILDTTGVTCIVDVGAHVGEFVELARLGCGYRGRIVSFEPTAASFQQLQATWAADPQWTGVQLALGRVSGTETIRTFTGSNMNSILQPSLVGRTVFPAEFAASGIEQVQVRRLDEVANDYFPTDDMVLLKIDTQGGDLSVIEGAVGILGQVVALIVELPVASIYDQMPTFCQLWDRIHELGFAASALFPIASAGLAVLEFDGYFVRSSFGEGQS